MQGVFIQTTNNDIYTMSNSFLTGVELGWAIRVARLWHTSSSLFQPDAAFERFDASTLDGRKVSIRPIDMTRAWLQEIPGEDSMSPSHFVPSPNNATQHWNTRRIPH